MRVDFLDTNILLYLFERVDTAKRDTATTIVKKALTEQSGVISFQVVQESLNAISQKVRIGAPPEKGRQFLHDVLRHLWEIMPSEQLYLRALKLHERYGYSFYDSLIISAALEAGCARLCTEDMQHGQVIEGLTIHNPFLPVEQ